MWHSIFADKQADPNAQTEALDNTYALTVRLRRSKKEKLALGLRLLEIKRQREETTIDTGKVRARHDRITQIAQVYAQHFYYFSTIFSQANRYM